MVDQSKECRSVLLSLLGWSAGAFLIFIGWILSQQAELFSLFACSTKGLTDKQCQTAGWLIVIIPVVLFFWNTAINKLCTKCTDKYFPFTRKDVLIYQSVFSTLLAAISFVAVLD
jgi:hypothetical protein